MVASLPSHQALALDPQHARILDQALPPSDPVLHAAVSDLNFDRSFGESVVALSASRIAAFDAQGIRHLLPHDEIESLKIEELFASARLCAHLKDGTVLPLLYYSRHRVPHFAAFVRLANDRIAGRPEILPDPPEPTHCRRCRSPLPERGAPCSLCVNRWHIFHRLIALIAPYWLRATGLVLATFAVVASQNIPPYLTKLIVDNVIEARNLDALPWLIAGMMGCGLLLLLARLANTFLSSWLAARLTGDLRNRLHEHIQRLELRYFQRRESGEIVGRVMHDTGDLQQFLIEGLPFFLVNVTNFFVIAAILLSLDVKLALLVFLPVPFLLGGGGLFWQHLVALFHKRGASVSALHSLLNESIYGIRIVKIFSQEANRAQRFNEGNERFVQTRMRLERTWGAFSEVMFWVMQLGVVAVWFVASRRIVQGDPDLTLGDLLAFVGYIWLFYGPLQWFTAITNWMSNAFAGAERIFALLDSRVEDYDPPDAVRVQRIRGEIAFRDVRFSYERGKEVLKGISFSVEPGEMIGLVGASGAGKSTLVNLLCRFFQPDSGQILIDGHPIERIHLADLRAQIGIVPQEPFLFNASILENIRCGHPTATFDDIVRAAKAAHAHEFILDKDDGYDTVIGERGASLSGGEKQRVSIARAILHDPPLLILDEATSAIDSETEKAIQEALARLVKGRTTLAIAHRLATLRNANRLIVLGEGEILESGTHEELLKRDGPFAKLVNAQAEINKLRSESHFLAT